MLEDTKANVLTEYEKVQTMGLPEEAQEKLLLSATRGLSFFNTSKMDLSKLGEADTKDHLESYIQEYSADARQIFEHFNFTEFISQLNDAGLLYEVVKKVRHTDLTPNAISNHDMGLTFEEVAGHELDRPCEQKSNRGRPSSTTAVKAQSPPKTFASKVFKTHEFDKA